MPEIKSDSGEMTFWEHLDDLRGTLIRSFIAIFIATIGAFLLKDFIYNTIILGPRNADFFTNRMLCKLSHIMNSEVLCINQGTFEIINIDLAGQFRSHLLISIVAGLIIGFPYFLFELWRFIKPGLYKKEIRNMKGFVFWTSFLFFIGISFGYFMIAPLAINFLINYTISPDVVNQIRLGSYISNVVLICLSTGIVFELPLLIYFLSRMGVITPKLMKKYRKHAVVFFFIASAIITPPDVFSQILVALPLLFLYEISIIISRRTVKKYALGG